MRTLSKTQAHIIQEMSDTMPALIGGRQLRSHVRQLPVLAMSSAIDSGDGRVLERLFQIYAHAANAYVWCDQNEPETVDVIVGKIVSRIANGLLTGGPAKSGKRRVARIDGAVDPFASWRFRSVPVGLNWELLVQVPPPTQI